MKKHNEFKDFWDFYNNLRSLPFEEIMDILLKELDIDDESQLSKLSTEEFGFINRELLDLKASMFFSIACEKSIEQIQKNHKNKKMFFFHKELYIGQDTDFINTYASLFPQRFILYTSDLYIHQKIRIEGTNKKIEVGSAVGTDLLRQYIRHKKLIQNELVYLFPTSCFQESKKYVTIPNFTKYKNKCFISGFENKLEIIPKTEYSNLIIELPWIKNAQVEEFIELKEKYKIEYERFQNKTDELMLKLQSGNTIESLLAKEYNEASLEIKNIIINRKSEMRKKGKEVILGTLCTMIPITLEQIGINAFDPKIISSIVGGTTIYNGVKDFYAKSNLEHDNPYWILYKWEQESKKRFK